MSKNPYEIRLDLLAMARDYLQSVADANERAARAAFELAVSQGTSLASDWSKFAPKGYSLEDVVKQAQELYGFVSRKD